MSRWSKDNRPLDPFARIGRADARATKLQRVSWGIVGIGLLALIFAVFLLVRRDARGMMVLACAFGSVVVGLVTWIVGAGLRTWVDYQRDRRELMSSGSDDKPLRSSVPVARQAISAMSVPATLRGNLVTAPGVLLLLISLVQAAAGRAAFEFMVCGVALVGLGLAMRFQGYRELNEARALLAGRRFIAHWRLNVQECRSFATRQRHEALGSIGKTFLVLLVIAWTPAAFIAGLAVFTGEWRTPALLEFTGGGFAFAAAVAALGYVDARQRYRLQLGSGGDVVVGRLGACVAGLYHSWQEGWVNKVTFERGTPAIINVHVDLGSFRGRSRRTMVEIPVSRGNERAFKQIARTLL